MLCRLYVSILLCEHLSLRNISIIFNKSHLHCQYWIYDLKDLCVYLYESSSVLIERSPLYFQSWIYVLTDLCEHLSLRDISIIFSKSHLHCQCWKYVLVDLCVFIWIIFSTNREKSSLFSELNKCFNWSMWSFIFKEY